MPKETFRIDDFRVYYNKTIQPELIRLEQMRIRVLRDTFFSLVLVAIILIVLWAYDLGFLLLLLVIPVAFYIFSLTRRAKRFIDAFKPAIVGLILSFLNESLNFRSLKYEPKRAILRDRFEKSGLFRPLPDVYEAEDYISGIVGEMVFEMGEAYVREISPASNRIQQVFSGFFVHAIFNEDMDGGQVAVWPRNRLRRNKRTVDRYVSRGGIDADIEIMNPGFRERFATYAKSGTVVKDTLTPAMQEAILEFTELKGRDVYFSIYDKDLFIGLTHDYDLMEPRLLKSNIDFGLIRQFYEDITDMLELIQRFDQTR